MIMSSKSYFRLLIKESKSHPELKQYSAAFISSGAIDSTGLQELLKIDTVSNKTVEFYKFLINKLHKIITEILSDEQKTACQCIKIITSLITQATITLEKQFNGNLEEANEFMDCIGLKELSNSLCTYFSTGDLSEIENQILRVKEDIIFVKSLD